MPAPRSTARVSEWSFSGTAADGQRVEAEGADLFTLREGEIVVKQRTA